MNIGIVGAGNIVFDFFEAAGKIDEMNLAAICATKRSEEKLKKICEDFKLEKYFCDYDEMLEDDSLETIYVAVPNNMHYDFSKKALLKGKNVILEKPFASCYEEAVELVNLAKEKGLFLFEAITNQYFPNYTKVKELIPSLGDIKIVELNFSQYSSRYDAFKRGEIQPVFDSEKSGGVLMDLNVYNIHFVVGLFGEPKNVHYFANVERNIDTSGILVMEYENFKCSCIGSKDSSAPLCVNIQGDKGYINSISPTNSFDKFKFALNKEGAEEFDLNEHKERLYYELESFVDMVNKNDHEKNVEQMNHSLKVMEILDKARKYAGIKIKNKSI
ncbi:MAG: Gfo/Idh/MocA family oxidoreductase [Clostridium sp.]|nr:Gfo/Idh/MocA family oxidoreductase [Clostridium sp.]